MFQNIGVTTAKNDTQNLTNLWTCLTKYYTELYGYQLSPSHVPIKMFEGTHSPHQPVLKPNLSVCLLLKFSISMLLCIIQKKKTSAKLLRFLSEHLVSPLKKNSPLKKHLVTHVFIRELRVCLVPLFWNFEKDSFHIWSIKYRLIKK